MSWEVSERMKKDVVKHHAGKINHVLTLNCCVSDRRQWQGQILDVCNVQAQRRLPGEYRGCLTGTPSWKVDDLDVVEYLLQNREGYFVAQEGSEDLAVSVHEQEVGSPKDGKDRPSLFKDLVITLLAVDIPGLSLVAV